MVDKVISVFWVMNAGNYPCFIRCINNKINAAISIFSEMSGSTSVFPEVTVSPEVPSPGQICLGHLAAAWAGPGWTGPSPIQIWRRNDPRHPCWFSPFSQRPVSDGPAYRSQAAVEQPLVSWRWAVATTRLFSSCSLCPYPVFPLG